MISYTVKVPWSASLAMRVKQPPLPPGDILILSVTRTVPVTLARHESPSNRGVNPGNISRRGGLIRLSVRGL